MKFNEKLQVLRKERKMSQEELADLLNVSRQAVSKWESGISYPEMDKLREICKIFRCSIDDLTNDEVKEMGKNNPNKNTLNNIVDEIIYIISKSVTMISHMNAKQLFNLLFGMLVILLVILIMKIPVDILYNLVNRVLMRYPSGITEFLSDLWYLLLNAGYLILSILLFIYVYKVKYLDNVEEVSKEIIIETKKEDNEVQKEKIIITNTPVNNKRFAFFDVLGKIFAVIAKFIILMFSMPFVCLLLCLSACFVIAIGLMFSGIVYIGVALGIFSSVVFILCILYLFIQVLFEHKVRVKLFAITVLASICLLGISMGISFFEISDIEISNELPNLKLKEEKEIIDYNDDIVAYFEEWEWQVGKINYEKDDSLTDKIEFTIKYPYEYYDYTLVNTDDNRIILHYNSKGNTGSKVYRQILSDLKRKELHDYTFAEAITITIRTSEANLNRIKENNQAYAEEQYNQRIIYDYEVQIDRLEDEIASLQSQLETYETENYNYEETIEEYKIKIQEYEEKISSIKDSLNN